MESLRAITLLERYPAVLLDAYGVLVTRDHALPGANAFLRAMQARGIPYFILTNAASRPPEAFTELWRGLGVEVPAERIITSGSLLAGYFHEHDLSGARCIVLGPDSAADHARQAGAEIVPAEAEAEVLVIADQAGYPLLETLDAVLTGLLARLERGAITHLLLPNPDLIYPTAPGRYGFTAGSLATMLEAVLAERFPTENYRFTRLGKPYPPIFEDALQRLGTRRAVMIGDQLSTDILGARNCALDSALIAASLGQSAIRPTYLLPRGLS
jgi:HAD superfamily hydrolase (TIGR01450 family)